jgi:predicted nucleic acid-binding protein
VVKAAIASQVQLLISTALVLEYEAVLTRPEHLAASALTVAEIERLVDMVCNAGIEVRRKWNLRPQLRDPNDEMVLETAIAGNAVAIVTFNHGHFVEACARFGIEVLSPQEVLRRMETI